MKQLAAEDPLELVSVAVPGGDSSYMAECLVEEYMLLGWSDDQLRSLFRNPFFQLPHQIHQARGDAYVCSLIREVRTNWGEQSGKQGESDA